MVDKLNRYTKDRPRLKKVVGWAFVVVGFVALALPIVPGAPLVFVGFEVLGIRFIFTERLRGLIGLDRAVPEEVPERSL
ncbi:MAG TPA: PGPGW domain-containing protein [Candidatus Paceibacterota bacterium]|nr:PGPGW domain-containing protein [Candidatus Paceibacterota bacterium]